MVPVQEVQCTYVYCMYTNKEEPQKCSDPPCIPHVILCAFPSQMSKSLIGGVRLVDLFEQIPPLFEACLPDASLRKKLDILRLLDKQLSKAVLKCVTTYRLNLNGESWDTNVDGASLLQSLNLKELNVSLRLTGASLWVLKVKFRSTYDFSPCTCLTHTGWI